MSRLQSQPPSVLAAIFATLCVAVGPRPVVWRKKCAPNGWSRGCPSWPRPAAAKPRPPPAVSWAKSTAASRKCRSAIATRALCWVIIITSWGRQAERAACCNKRAASCGAVAAATPICRPNPPFCRTLAQAGTGTVPAFFWICLFVVSYSRLPHHQCCVS